MMITPDKILSYSIHGNSLTAVCTQGKIQLTPYSDNILHFLYSPSTESCYSPMWGIDARPDPNVTVHSTQLADAVSFCLPSLSIQLHLSNSVIDFIRPDGSALLSLLDYSMEPASVLGEDTYHIRVSFSATDDEKFFGLGQHQDGKLDLGGREQILWHDYSHKGGEIVAIPFLVTNKKYGIVFDNPSRMKVTPGINGRTIWQAEVGDTISFFIMSGSCNNELYSAFRLLTGITPLPPRKGLGFIQCKQRYSSEQELMEVAETYYEKQYPCDIFVVDWFHWKTLGDLKLDPAYWPDSLTMNRRLEEMGYDTMISCWPRFMKESDNYSFLEQHGWFMKDAEEKTIYGTPDDQRGALIDTTNPECGKWYFDTIKKNYADLGYKYYWTDEDEPDISPHSAFLHAGTGARIHNIYPLTHTKCIYEGHRSSFSHRCLTLSRASYLGAQQYGTTFWSSDIFPEWDVLKRQIPTALNFCASGMPYWSSDIGGWQALPDEDTKEDYSSLLIQTSSQGTGAVTKNNYAELYIRWFQFGVFCPTFRTHGTRKQNEIWSYGETAEQILVKYLRLRYHLMPYIYSLAYQVTLTGSPIMRALWMDFPEDTCTQIEDEFLFGPSLLVAPVVEQGASSRQVYLPEGCSWYNYWTDQKIQGGQTITVSAPIDVLPLFVKEGSILPVGEILPNSSCEQKNIELHIYTGADTHFSLYSDDGVTYAYEKGEYSLIDFSWDEQTQKLTEKNIHNCDAVCKKYYSIIIHR